MTAPSFFAFAHTRRGLVKDKVTRAASAHRARSNARLGQRLQHTLRSTLWLEWTTTCVFLYATWEAGREHRHAWRINYCMSHQS